MMEVGDTVRIKVPTGGVTHSDRFIIQSLPSDEDPYVRVRLTKAGEYWNPWRRKAYEEGGLGYDPSSLEVV
jgi:hypothetical protein